MGKQPAVSAMRFGDQGQLMCPRNNTYVWNLMTALLLTHCVTLSGHFTLLSLSPVIFKG